MKLAPMLVVLSCAAAALATPVGVRHPLTPGGLTIEQLGAPGDSTTYRLRWGAARAASSYRVHVTAVAWATTGWSGLPTNTIVTDTTLQFTAVHAAYDSVRFQAEVWSRQGTREHPTSATATWELRRLGPPGPVIVDSLLQLAAIHVRPQHVVLVPGQQQEFCGLLEFKGGALALSADSRSGYCDGLLGLERQSTGAPSPSLVQQAVADTTCLRWSATGGTMTSPPCPAGLGAGPSGGRAVTGL